MSFKHKHILGIEQMSKEDIETILDTADAFKEINSRDIKKVPTLRGKTIINAFFEASTRTRLSFEIAGKRLSADTVNISGSTSSVVKGETLEDTARNIEAMAPDIIVIRHGHSGAPHYLAERVDCSIVNAGDGAHEHPSQALLDMMTMREHKSRIEGLEVAIIGDITHSRVVRSNIYCLSKMGANVRLCGPGTMLPPGIEQLGNVKVLSDMREAIKNVDVVMMLRLQTERMQGQFIPSAREYHHLYGLTEERLKRAAPDALVMHPGPMNRGVEIDSDVADMLDRSIITGQVEMGVAVRMACLDILTRSARRVEGWA